MALKQSNTITADKLWQLKRIGNVAISPDTTQVVCTVTTYSMDDDRGSTQLWRLASDRSEAPRQLTTVGEKCGAPAFSPDGLQIAFVARREVAGKKDDSPQLYLLPADGGEARRVSDFAPGIESFKWLADGKRIVFAAWTWPDLKGAPAQAAAHKADKERKDTAYVTDQAYYRFWDHHLPQGRRLQLWLLDTTDGRVRGLFEGKPFELPRESGGEAYATSPDGRHIAFSFDPAPEQKLGNRCAIAEIDLRTGRIAPRAEHIDWDFAAPAYAPDGRTLAMLAAHVGAFHTALAQPAVVPATGAWRLLVPGWDHSVDAPLRWAADGRTLRFTAEERGRCHLWELPLHRAAEPKAIFLGGWVQGFDAAGDAVAIAADSATHPAQVHLLREGARPKRLEPFNDALLKRLKLGEVREESIAGAGGEPVQMWLTFPPGFDPKRKHAVIHFIHGGPFAAAGDTFSWRWNAHVLAAHHGQHGAVIAQVNFHGSSGFGWAFRHSLIGRQGELEFQDIEAATDALSKKRWADPRRFFVTGGSYGGFMVAWINGHVPEGRYRATICHAGVYDRVATFSADSYPVRPKDLAANWWDDMPRVLAQSPNAFAGAMRTPTLVIHGAQDFRVPDHNGLAYYNTLKALGVPARLLWFPDENHWVLKPRNSRQWYSEFSAWLNANDLR